MGQDVCAEAVHRDIFKFLTGSQKVGKEGQHQLGNAEESLKTRCIRLCIVQLTTMVPIDVILHRAGF